MKISAIKDRSRSDGHDHEVVAVLRVRQQYPSILGEDLRLWQFLIDVDKYTRWMETDMSL